LTGGSSTADGLAIFAGINESLALTDCVVTGNQTTRYGGTIGLNTSAALTLQRSPRLAVLLLLAFQKCTTFFNLG
jgi:hypothetical protein